MSTSSFLDKGILLGYCFSINAHHRECRDYLFRADVSPYYTEDVREAFEENKDRMVRDHRTELLHHARVLEQSSYGGALTETELDEIRSEVVTRSDYPNAWRYLGDYYEALSSPSVKRILDEIREIAREIESTAHTRFSEMEGMVTLWSRAEAYPTVQTALDEIRSSKEEDLWICIDAHDLAERVDRHTELATTDFNDLIDGGRRELILEHTSLDDVIGVGVTT